LIEVRQVVKEYENGRVQALRGLDLDVGHGELVSVIGPSGCGKSTLLKLLGALDRPSAGEIRFDGSPLGATRDLASFRAREIGFVFQSFHLIPVLTALENVQVPMLETGWSATERRRRAEELLGSVGLAERLHHRPAALSGGERQRVAVARSLANEPRLILADEPTGNLDSDNAGRIIELLLETHRAREVTMVIVTHDPLIAASADRTVRMLDGRVVEDEARSAAAR
jgi:putative ABC transport system ATP-binding protein